MLCKRCELLDSTSLFPSVPCRGCSRLGSGFQRRVPERWRQHLHFRRSSTGSICRLPCPDAGTSDGYRIEVLPEAQGALDPDRSRHRTQTRETLGVWQRFHQVSGKYDPKSFWKPKQAVYRCRHESPAGIIAINDGNGSPSRAGWGDER